MDHSRVYTFIDKNSSFNIYYLDAASLLKDIYSIHNIGPIAAKFYDQTILSAMHLVNFTKINENLGYYIDSEDPYFRFKIELNNQGTMRTLLLPEEFEEFPNSLNGKARVSISYPNKSPYSSMIELKSTAPAEVFNQILETSYQTNARTLIGDKTSIMINQLPASNIDQKFDEIKTLSASDAIKKHEKFLNELLKMDFENDQECIDHFKKEGFIYLASKKLKFNCPCSKERMITNLLTLSEEDQNDVFKDGQIEIRCDYCNSIYEIQKDDIKNKVQ